MGWDVELNRKLAVPLAVKGLLRKEENRVVRIRILKDSEQDSDDLEFARKLAENRVRIDGLLEDIENKDPEGVDSPEIETELDYIEASIQLGLLEITGELEEVPYSDELFEEAAV
jgi:hypothetical protein